MNMPRLVLAHIGEREGIGLGKLVGFDGHGSGAVPFTEQVDILTAFAVVGICLVLGHCIVDSFLKVGVGYVAAGCHQVGISRHVLEEIGVDGIESFAELRAVAILVDEEKFTQERIAIKCHRAACIIIEHGGNLFSKASGHPLLDEPRGRTICPASPSCS